jgi:predicted alpha/beta-fold hydrolase
MAKSYERLGLDVCCMNFRGCSGEPNDTVGAYHLGFTDDVKHYLDVLRREGSSKPIYLSAFSLGANVMMKALGELGEDAVTKYNVQGAALFCCPLNCEKHYTRLMEPGINKIVYNDSILKSLQNKAQLQLERCCDNDPDTLKFNYRGAMEADTIYEFENTYIAPIYGFDDPIDYYRKTASINEIENVAVPTFVLNGADDTFMDGSYQPVEVTREHGGRAPVKMVFSEQGGHCGFIFHQLEESEPIPETSFGPSEMARFIEHVMNSSV